MGVVSAEIGALDKEPRALSEYRDFGRRRDPSQGPESLGHGRDDEGLSGGRSSVSHWSPGLEQAANVRHPGPKAEAMG
jgi:hypothetical protein